MLRALLCFFCLGGMSHLGWSMEDNNSLVPRGEDVSDQGAKRKAVALPEGENEERVSSDKKKARLSEEGEVVQPALEDSALELFKLGFEQYKKKNFEEAAELYEKAAAGGSVRAQYNLGALYDMRKCLK